MASIRRFAVLEHYRDPAGFHDNKLVRSQFQPATGAAYQKLTPAVIFDLLEGADKMFNAIGKPNVIPARALLERMSQSDWTCTATAHERGKGAKPDPYLHFNIWFKRDAGKPQAYHVRCHEREAGGLYVFQVTFG